MQTTLNIIQLILSIALLVVLLLQVKGGGGLGGIFGGGESVYRTRRGVEKYLFWATITIAVLFVLSSIVSVAVF